jgi:hypothetical protein
MKFIDKLGFITVVNEIYYCYWGGLSWVFDWVINLFDCRRLQIRK